MAKTWKAGVIGCGAVAQALHLPGYMRCPGVAVEAACDPAPRQRKEAGRLVEGLSTYRDYRRMLDRHELDVVSVCSPNRFHAEHAIAALERGAHVLLEKPAALSMKEIARIKRAVKRSGRQLVVGFSQRFKRGNIRIQKLLADRTIGEPFMIRIRFAHTGPYPGWARDDWFYSPTDAGGGAMLDMGIHAIDLAQWHIGPIKRVQAATGTLRKKIKVDDNAVLLLEFANGKTLGYLEVGWTSPAGFNGVEILGDNGCIVEDYGGVLTVTTGKITPDLRKQSKLTTRVVDKDPNRGGWDVEVTEVVKAFRRGDNLGCGIDAGGSALAVALAAYQSSRTGKRVDVASMK